MKLELFLSYGKLRNVNSWKAVYLVYYFCEKKIDLKEKFKPAGANGVTEWAKTEGEWKNKLGVRAQC